MEADRHAEADEGVHHGEDPEVEPGDETTPQEPEGGDEADEGQRHGDDGDAALERRRVWMRMRLRIGHR
jgi:hypothetical protein